MVLSRERDAERPPMSVILPQLYLGAESDVTQDRLADRGISYVLSVSRCSPQPPFLPRSRFLRVPIDDSLRADLLPWIPPALRFIDAAVSSGSSVLVHCAAGISRSPAVAVAYIMYSLGMDLDQAYRFVKERRPSISPNFNFLGQLQHFQGSLSQKASDGDLVIRPLDAGLPSTDSHTSSVAEDSAEEQREHTNNLYNTDKVEQRYSHSCGSGNLSLSVKLRTLNLTVGENQREVQMPGELARPPPNQLQLPAGSASLLEKRKSLSLSLSPLGSGPPACKQISPTRTGSASTYKTVHKRETGVRHKAKRHSNKPPAGGATSGHAGEAQGQRSSSHSRLEDQEQDQKQDQEQGLSPLSLTLNKLLGWGERMLLGGLLGPPVRLGQTMLPQGGAVGTS